MANFDITQLMGGDSDIKKKVFLILFVVLAISFAGAAFILFGDNTEEETKKITDSFNIFSQARALGATNDLIRYISPTFNDGGLKFNTMVKSLSKKNPGYQALLMNVTIGEDGNQAELSYKRTEKVNGKAVQLMIVNEMWQKEEGEWRLFQLSQVDRDILTGKKKLGDFVKAAANGEEENKPADTETAKKGIEGEMVAESTPKNVDKEKTTATSEQVEEVKPLPKSKVAEEAIKKEPDSSAQKEAEVEGKPKMPKEYPVYNAEGKRDPFKSLIVGLDDEDSGGPLLRSAKCDENRPREALEGFDLFAVNLVGIVTGKQNFALIETPNGSGYTVKTGMHIGKNCGRVERINRNKMVVAEKYYDSRGKIRISKSEIKLKQEEK